MTMQEHGYREGRTGEESGSGLMGIRHRNVERNTHRTMLLFMLVSVVLQGCVVIPIPTSEHGLTSGRGEITEEAAVGLEMGKTTWEDVLLRFGEPSAILQDGRVFLYHWATIRGYMLWGILYTTGGGVMAISKDYVFLLEFDDSARLRRFERASLGFFESGPQYVDQWIKGSHSKQ